MKFLQARDEMFAVFQAVWTSLGLYAAYEDVTSKPPSDNEVWARVTLRHTTGGLAALTGATGKRRYERAGTLFVQVFCPAGAGNTAGYSASQAVVDAYQKAIGRPWYRNVRINEVGTSGAFEQTNVMVDFTYEDIN